AEPAYVAPAALAPLSRAIDEAARERDSRILAAEAASAGLEAILDAMGEAVLALDTELRIVLANPAAAALFGLGSRAAARGRDLLAATRSTVLHAAARDCLETGLQREAELSLFLPGERSFMALAAPLTPPSAEPGAEGTAGGRGVVLVLNDVTELRRLERVRRDFVANVSHELRTPVQLVKGFAEALREGALGDGAKADRFLGIIERNAARMEALIADLLALASLEGEGRGWIEAEETSIAPILEAAAEAVGAKAEAKGMAIRVDAEAALSARVNAGLLEQAVVNLIDNAVKYSPAGSSVAVRAARGDEGFFRVEVKDEGMGIPARDLGRIFERFYRVDRARSRELGGTGLGLAIVRHIALAHGGSASVESWEGEGSTFVLRLPLAGPPSMT
ncbi:MAG: ATP-binding protein, partial [Spirochaetaceae bacterium]|nr:ATP-binding protein [Spirochaetaceae bacterium]